MSENSENLEELFQLLDKNGNLQLEIRKKLLKNGKELFPLLLQALSTNRSSRIRRNAALVLGELANRQAVLPLIQALNDRAVSVSSNAAFALGMIGDERAVPHLVKRLNSAAWQIRFHAAVSLGWLKDKKAGNPLFKLLRDPHSHVRKAASFALGQMADPAWHKSLHDLLRDPGNPSYHAAVVLAYLGDLTGYYYLEQLSPYMFSYKPFRKNKAKAAESLRVGNLLFSSSLYSASANEYHCGLTNREIIPSNIQISLFNNLGNAFRAVGRTTQAIVPYMLALRMKPWDQNIAENLEKAEILADVQDLVFDRIKQFLMYGEIAQLKPPNQIPAFFEEICETFQMKKSEYLSTFYRGWRIFYAFEKLQGATTHIASTPIPFDFLLEHTPQCKHAFNTEPQYRSFYLLFLRLSESFIPNPQEKPETVILKNHDAMTYGYISGLLQKIWTFRRMKFSNN